MRQYPRIVHKGRGQYRKVWNEQEEIEAGNDGFESHWNPEIVEKRKGTDRAILRGKSEPKKVEIKEETIKDEFDYRTLKWPQLKTYAKELEGIYKTEIVTRTSKRDDILEKIDGLMNGNG